MNSNAATPRVRLRLHPLWRCQFLISPDCVSDASLVPETCLQLYIVFISIKDPVRQAKADMRNGAWCPMESMAPVLAIADMVASAVPGMAL